MGYRLFRTLYVDQIKYSTKGIADILRAFDEYLEFGSFPAIPVVNKLTKEFLLREYFNTMLLKDIIQRHSVSTPNQCISLYKYLISCISKPVTIESCYKHIKTSGLTTSKDYIKDYIKYAMDTYFLFNIDIFSDSLKQKEINPKKSYCIDWGLVHYNSPVWDGHKTRALENLIFIHLRQKYSDINYYLTKTEREEINFVVSSKRQVPEMLIQVSMDVSDTTTFNRELNPLIKSAKYFNCKNNFVITYNQENQLSEQNVEINFIPAYKFLLDF